MVELLRRSRNSYYDVNCARYNPLSLTLCKSGKSGFGQMKSGLVKWMFAKWNLVNLELRRVIRKFSTQITPKVKKQYCYSTSKDLTKIPFFCNCTWLSTTCTSKPYHFPTYSPHSHTCTGRGMVISYCGNFRELRRYIYTFCLGQIYLFYSYLQIFIFCIQSCTCHCITISHWINLPLLLNTRILSPQFFLHVVYIHMYFVCKQCRH
jgi:hypothetical protein